MRREREAQVMRTSRPVSRSASRAGTAVSAATGGGGTANAPVRTAHVQVRIQVLFTLLTSLNELSLAASERMLIASLGKKPRKKGAFFSIYLFLTF